MKDVKRDATETMKVIDKPLLSVFLGLPTMLMRREYYVAGVALSAMISLANNTRGVLHPTITTNRDGA